MPKLTTAKKEARIEAKLPSGFRDYEPREAIARQKMIATIRTTFERFGFDPMETPAAERTDVLLSGDAAASKIIFAIQNADEKKSDKSLRFDLTVPLARFMAAYSEIPKPFKRYQIGNVWRGERAQAGRYREFMQADIDTVGFPAFRESEVAAEIIATIFNTLKELNVGQFIIKINSRKLLNNFFEDSLLLIPSFYYENLMRILDKRDKISREKLREDIKSLLLDDGQTDKIMALVDGKLSDELKMALDRAIGLSGLKTLKENLEALDVDPQYYEFDYTLARGLSYYSGVVFETILSTAPELGSVASGGQYDYLVKKFTGNLTQAMGGSIGVDRLFTALENSKTIEQPNTLTKVLILNLLNTPRNEYLSIAQQLRTSGINTSIYLGRELTLEGQLPYAIKKEIPYVLIYGENEQKKGVVAIKNLATREQKEFARTAINEIVEYFKK